VLVTIPRWIAANRRAAVEAAARETGLVKIQYGGFVFTAVCGRIQEGMKED
jgi:hypothetical protein